MGVADHRRGAGPARGHGESRAAHGRGRGRRVDDRSPQRVGALAVPDRRPRRRRRGAQAQAPVSRPAPRADATEPAQPRRGQRRVALGDGRAGLRRDRDADAHCVDARRRARLRRSVALARRRVLRPAPESAAVQAAPDGRRHGPLLPDRALPARRRPARGSAVRVHAARRRDELRRPARRARRGDGGGARGRGEGAPGGSAGDRSDDHLARGDGAVRHRQARYPFRDGVGRARPRCSRSPSSARSPVQKPSRDCARRAAPRCSRSQVDALVDRGEAARGGGAGVVARA